MPLPFPYPILPLPITSANALSSYQICLAIAVDALNRATTQPPGSGEQWVESKLVECAVALATEIREQFANPGSRQFTGL